VLASINVGRSSGAGDVVVDESLNRVITTGLFEMRSTIIDGASNTIIATIDSTQIPSDVALDPATHRAYIANQMFLVQEVNLAGSALEATIVTGGEASPGVINTSSHLYYLGRTVAATDVQRFDKCGASATVAGQPHGNGRYTFLAVNRNTNRIYALNTATNLAGNTISIPGFVSVIDGASNAVIANVEVGNQPFGIGVNEATNKIYVVNVNFGPDFPGGITVIDGATNTAVDADTSAFPPGTRFFTEVVANEATNRIYFQINGLNGLAGVLDGATNVATPLPASLGPVTAIRVNKVLNRVYILSSPAGLLHVLDGATDAEIATIPIGPPAGTTGNNIAVNEITGQVFVANSSDDTVRVIDGATNSVIATISVADGPESIGINELANRIYVGSGFGGAIRAISFIDGASMMVEATLNVPLSPRRFSVDASRSRIYLSTAGGGVDLSGVMIVSDIDGTIDSLRQAIISATEGDPPGTRNSMLSKLDNAEDAFDGGNTNAAINKLQALANEIEAQRDKKLTDAEADQLLALISAVIDGVC
jgi:YVTN family beta-propeller protein